MRKYVEHFAIYNSKNGTVGEIYTSFIALMHTLPISNTLVPDLNQFYYKVNKDKTELIGLTPRSFRYYYHIHNNDIKLKDSSVVKMKLLDITDTVVFLTYKVKEFEVIINSIDPSDENYFKYLLSCK